MKRLEEILNCIGDFYTNIAGELISFSGILSSSEESVVLHCKINIKSYRKIDRYSPLKMWGKVNGIPVTLLNVYAKNGSWRNEETCISITFAPSEIVIGRSYPKGALVTQISISISELNGLFSSSPLQSVHGFSKENPSVLQYTFPDIIEVDDKYGHLMIYQTFSEEWSWNEIKYKILPVIEYDFNQPVEIMDAVSKIAAVRNLFSFFANHYLPLKEITFADLESKNQELPTLCDCALYLNHREDISISDGPFLIMTSAFSKSFETVWDKWLTIYEEAPSIPTLFYEIICNRSTRINRFLNLAQAIEVYSRRYREEAVIKVARVREKTRPNKEPPVHLNHRFEDILLLLNPCLEIADSKIFILSDSLADMRNFFTHYNKPNYVEPSYQEVFAAVHILEFVLLAIIYHHVGIPNEYIKSSKRRVEFQRFDEFIELLSKELSKTTEQ